ncbi:TetR/AcrR family transcriptional regulator [Allorhizobium sp. BGMRC 0089]|uniref:TetR/AcrR family transcriptional regulator n=1 Tax=Allorhizobium sonneratiae TaxID=2934936 RepID=UPI002034A1F2|nr:TetR/AcrR family transcriptional regulator [Allorhizobium sonneratiae]MCM2292397.1 TetR/AcrR family transcriptional regulator [Allorhizobium sonneratiae]
MSQSQSNEEKRRQVRASRAGRPRLGADKGRETILWNALQCFARRGYDGVHLRDLAQQAGVNIALANYHFGSKFALWQACLEQLQSRATEAVVAIGSLEAADLRYPQKLVNAYRIFIRFNSEYPDYGLFILQEMLAPGERQDSVKKLLIDPFQEVLMPLLSEGAEQGFIQTNDVMLLFFTHSVAISHVVAAQGLMGQFFTPESRRKETLKELLTMMVRSATGAFSQEFEEAVGTCLDFEK